MTPTDVDDLLDRVHAVRHTCDLDVLLFFVRHPNALLTSEQLATWLGHESKRIAESVELLLEAGFLTRLQTHAHAARLFVFNAGSTSGPVLPLLTQLGSTREGRIAIKEALARRAARDGGGPAARASAPASRLSRPYVVARRSSTPRTTERR